LSEFYYYRTSQEGKDHDDIWRRNTTIAFAHWTPDGTVVTKGRIGAVPVGPLRVKLHPEDALCFALQRCCRVAIIEMTYQQGAPGAETTNGTGDVARLLGQG
jgi:hypothetical protein